jgi:hypothetical protein
MIAAIMFISFTSCQDKDGKFSPKRKISKTYIEESQGEKQLVSTYLWDKDLLSRIDYSGHYLGLEGYSLKFEYEKKRISKIVGPNGIVIKFFYDGSKYDKIEQTYTLESENPNYASSSQTVYKFGYNGNKIDKMTVTTTWSMTFDLDFKGEIRKKAGFNPLALVFSEQTCKNIERTNKNIEKIKFKKGSKETFSESDTYTIFLTWNGNNIEKEVHEYTEDGKTYTDTYTYTHDKKNNPLYGLFIANGVANGGMLSENNVTKMVSTSSDDDNVQQMDYSYEYDKNFPVECIIQEKGESDFYKTYYEYVK